MNKVSTAPAHAIAHVNDNANDSKTLEMQA